MTGHAILAPMLMAVIMGLCLLAFCTVVLAFGYFSMGLGTAALDTLALVALADSACGRHAWRGDRLRIGPEWGENPAIQVT